MVGGIRCTYTWFLLDKCGGKRTVLRQPRLSNHWKNEIEVNLTFLRSSQSILAGEEVVWRVTTFCSFTLKGDGRRDKRWFTRATKTWHLQCRKIESSAVTANHKFAENLKNTLVQWWALSPHVSVCRPCDELMTCPEWTLPSPGDPELGFPPEMSWWEIQSHLRDLWFHFYIYTSDFSYRSGMSRLQKQGRRQTGGGELRTLA